MASCTLRSGIVLSLILTAAACGTVETFEDAAGADAVAVDSPEVDAADIDAPDIDAPDIDAPMIDAPTIDAPTIDAPVIDAPVIDAPMIDAPMIDAPPIDAPMIDAPTTQTLIVTPAGTGSGTVSSSPVGINCGGDCQENYVMGTTVTLTATAAASSTFAGWSGGGCSGTGTCVVTVNALTAVTATFTLRTYTLTVNRTGAGVGSVASSPAGISCGADCQEVYNHGQQVTLTATPSGAGNTFTGWSGGGCSGTGTCVVTMTAATTVSANFEPASYTLTVVRAGNGVGTVTSAPSGISCGADCTQTYLFGTSVTLTAAAATSPTSSLSTFTGWSGGGCTGTGTCVVSIAAATTVTATFSLQPNFAFVTSTNNHTGNLGGLAGADAICQARAQAVNLPGTYRAWLSTTTVNAIDRLGSASGWIRVDGKPLVNSRADLAAQRLFHPLRIHERNVDVGVSTALTATTSNGTKSSISSTCADWTATPSETVYRGATESVGGPWTLATGTSCTVPARLYCFGIDRAATVTITPPANYRRAFTTRLGWTPGGGIADADAQCNEDAAAAGLPGTYRAVLATTTTTAASRFNAGAGTLPWGRPDGVLLQPTAAEIFSETLWDTSPNPTANLGEYTGNHGNWFGARTLSTVGDAALTCNNWTSTAGTAGGRGRSGYTDTETLFSNNVDSVCAADHIRVTCFQQ